jgi:hypothetical protein
MAVRESIERIHEAKGPDHAIGSTSEHIMYALALCDREFLPNSYRNCDLQDWWSRLDDAPRGANKETRLRGVSRVCTALP